MSHSSISRPRGTALWLQRLARWQTQSPGVFIAVGLVATLLGVWACAGLSLRTRFEDLLPASSPSVIELRRLLRETERGGQIYVLLEGPSQAAERQGADAVAASLRSLAEVQGAVSGVHDARRFLLPRLGLFASVPALERVEQTLREQLSWSIGEALGLNLVEPPAPRDPEQALRELWPPEALGLASRFPEGYFEDRAGGVVVVVDTRVADGDLTRARALLDAVQDRTRQVLSAPAFAGVGARYAGNLVTGLAEYGAAARDLLDVGLLGVGLVLGVVMLYFMRWRVLVLLGLVVAAGLAWTFGLAALIFGHINLASGALISLIAGSSVNHGIIFMARYFEERARGASAGEAIHVAHAATGSATLTASVAGAAAYGCLAAGDFPLLDHFAVVGALGMLLCWLSTALLLGPALARWESWRPLAAGAGKRFGWRHERPVLLLVSRFARPIALGGAALTVLGLVASVAYARVLPTEHDMRRLQNDLGDSSELYAASRRCAEILGAALESSMLVLAERPDQVPELLRALEARRDEAAPGERPFEAVHGLQRFVPAEQPRKLELLASIRATLLRIEPHLDAERWQTLEPLLPPAGLEPITLDTLPEAMAAPFTDRHGVRGRIVLIEPAVGHSDSDLVYLMRWADAFRETRLSSGEVVYGSGRAVVFADMLRAVEIATPRTLALGLCVTTLVLALFFRGARGTWVAFAALLAGLGWLGGLMSVAGVKLNFMNFIALPVTFGIAVDYPVNFLARLRSEPDGDVLRALGGTGGAIILCSATTLLGYGALLASDNQAIRSLGLLCVMGELACVSAATLVLPAVLLSLQRWRAGKRAPGNTPRSDTELPRTRCREV